MQVRFDAWDWLLVAVSVLAPGASAVLSQFAKASDGAINPGPLTGQVLAAFGAPIAAGVIAYRAKRSEASAAEREVTARALARTDLNEAIDPVVRRVGELLLAGRQRRRLEPIAESIKSLVPVAAVQVVGPERGARSCYFDLKNRDVLAPTRYFSGRTGTPRTTFRAGTADGDAAIEMVLINGDRLCEDVRADPPPGWADRDRDYRTFASVAVVAGDNAYGMLTVDACEPGDITRDDLAVLRVLADLMACAFVKVR